MICCSLAWTASLPSRFSSLSQRGRDPVQGTGELLEYIPCTAAIAVGWLRRSLGTTVRCPAGLCVKFSQWLCCTICAFRTELPLSSSSSIIFFFFILVTQLRYSSPAPLSFADSLQELFVVGICHGIGEAHQLGTGLQASQPQGGNSKGLIYTRRHAGYPQNDI